ncbi:MAG: 4-hydroxyphenylpyruvate dioxygenase [uncultured Solirubrobacteraceae bacterium]|uniref:4-hydroxyphenylpyruvate dioxygenase n=1 Tax=uncultured Solirubrobacteraceae bacterium TaxID=1162706 RepID=A0A6J4R1Z0_9ACTN|nr:MAG: 4-hydroxyphenylpyruvate dioxygenase [uncultured Solirubrobacteraceae bacterium]
MTDSLASPAVGATAPDDMPLNGIDHIELHVGNAAQAAAFYREALGFREVAYAGLETGRRDCASHVLEQGGIRLVLTGALIAGHPVGRHVAAHGDGVKVVALSVPDAEQAFRLAVERGAVPVSPPARSSDEHGEAVLATVRAYGPVVHTFVERGAYAGAFLPGYAARSREATGAGLLAIDHVVGNVALGDMEKWVGFYERVFGMRELNHFTDEAISTEYSALMSKVLSDGTGRVKFPINEPAEGRRRSQIDEFLEFHAGPGVQHLALTTEDIVATVGALRERGIEFLRTPDSYYEELPGRVGDIAEPLEELRRHGILADRDDEGYLLQVFSRPLGDRPTLFIEVIERHGATGFGHGNFKALFEALEREQALRGNL